MSENIGTLYRTQVPSLNDAADIQLAFKLYHYGTTTVPSDPANILAESIAGNFKRLDDNSVNISGAQTISGAKTFSSAMIASNTLGVTGTFTASGNAVIGSDNQDTLTVNSVSTFASNSVFGATAYANSLLVQSNTMALNNALLGSSYTPSDANAAGGGIVLKGTSEKNILWSSGNWTASENFNLASGKTYKIATTEVLSATSVLGIAKTNLMTLDGAQTVSGVKTFSGAVALNGGLSIGGSGFSVDGANGNTSIGGTLSVAGNFSVNTNKFVITASSGNTSIAGQVRSSGTIRSDSGLIALTSTGSGATMYVSHSENPFVITPYYNGTAYSDSDFYFNTTNNRWINEAGYYVGGETVLNGGLTSSGSTLLGSNSNSTSLFVPGADNSGTYIRYNGSNRLGVGPTGTIAASGVYSNTLSTSYRSVYVTSSTAPDTLGYVASSRRFKKNIEPLGYTAEQILSIEPVEYNYKSEEDSAPKHVGMIAEEMHDAGLHAFVSYDEEGLPETIQYEFYVSALQQVVRHQAQQIEALEARLTALENK
jgi:hypothetical protein